MVNTSLSLFAKYLCGSCTNSFATNSVNKLTVLWWEKGSVVMFVCECEVFYAHVCIECGPVTPMYLQSNIQA